MTALDEFQALTTAIGEYSVDTLGREKLSGLQVILNPRELSAFVSIALRDRSDEAQRAAISEMFDVERVYADEISLSYVFVDEIEKTADAHSSVPQYSFA
ncbi:MAG TPA: hypothetical protein VGM84_11485 [Steroidobacteraceae bacterium]|jgi:hypothetical protein